MGKSNVLAGLTAFYTKMNEFRIQELHTDVCIQCEDEIFKCHQLVLSAASEYFECMFRGHFEESQKSIITLHEMDNATFRAVLKFAYSGDIVVSDDNVYNLLRASDFLRLPVVENLCLEYLKNHVSLPNDIIKIFHFCNALNKQAFVTISSRYILRYIHLLSKTEEYLEIEADDLMLILAGNKFTCPNEDMLLDAITRWIHYSYSDRRYHLVILIFLARFDRIPISHVFKYCDEYPGKSVLSDLHVESKVEKKDLSLYVYVDTDYGTQISTNMVKYEKDRESTSWFHSTHRESSFISSYEMRINVLDNNYLYVLKSFPERNQHEFFVSKCSDLSPEFDLKLPPFNLSHEFDMCHLENSADIILYDKINYKYMFKNELYEREFSKGVYVYKCVLNQWLLLPPLVTSTMCSSLTAGNNQIYLVGGRFLDGVYPEGYARAYDVRTSKWQSLPKSMNTFEAPTCCFHKGKLYVTSIDSDVPDCEIYDPVAGKWYTLGVPCNGERKRLIASNDELFKFSQSTTNCGLSVELYDNLDQEWNVLWTLQNELDTVVTPFSSYAKHRFFDAFTMKS